MIKQGDRVKFLNDVGGGKVNGFQSKKVALVEGDDGFELPVLITELVKVDDVDISYNSINRDFSTKPQDKKVEPAPEPEFVPEIIKGNDAPKFFMAFYPNDQNNPVGGEIEIYLINDSNFAVLYHVCSYDGQKYTTIEAGELDPNSKYYLDGLAQADLSDLPKYIVRLIPYMPDAKKLLDPIVKEISVSAVKFYKEKSFKESEFFEGNAMVFDLVTDLLKEEIDKLTDKDFEKVIKQKDEDYRPKIEAKKKLLAPEIVEVDLHIDELIDNKNGLSNHEILTIQLDKFESEMKLAIADKAKRIVFIHGVGNGVLKEAVYKKLKSTYARFNYQDASFKEYGFGATMVTLRRGN